MPQDGSPLAAAVASGLVSCVNRLDQALSPAPAATGAGSAPSAALVDVPDGRGAENEGGEGGAGEGEEDASEGEGDVAEGAYGGGGCEAPQLLVAGQPDDATELCLEDW